MIRFSELEYKRPDVEELKKKIEELKLRFISASSFEEQLANHKEFEALWEKYRCMAELCFIWNTLDTRNEFWKEEKAYFDEFEPLLSQSSSEYSKALSASKFKSEFEVLYGAQFFRLIKNELKVFSPEIIQEMQEENRLCTEYSKLMSGIEIEFDGKKLSLSQMTPYKISTDRAVRKAAFDACFEGIAKIEFQLDEIFSQLVIVRNRKARKLGYKDYTQMSYDVMQRVGYNSEMLAKYRKQIRKGITPIGEILYKRQKKRLRLPKMEYYDRGLGFLSGNPKPVGDRKTLVQIAQNMYNEMHPEMGDFYKILADNGYMDLDARLGKRGGGYCTYIPYVGLPFIFANFNGTSGDTGVLTHEFGHTFEAYCAKQFGLLSYIFPTTEFCEVHSMTMELITWPWMEKFYGADIKKFKFEAMEEAINLLLSTAAGDEFQHFMYENPDLSPAERKLKWKEISKKYYPYVEKNDCDFLLRGAGWLQVQHLFVYPFYYIDYGLAEICALQFWKKSLYNQEETIQNYVKLCKIGGSLSFLEGIKKAGLISPFEDGCVESIVKDISQWFKSIDDSQF